MNRLPFLTITETKIPCKFKGVVRRDIRHIFVSAVALLFFFGAKVSHGKDEFFTISKIAIVKTAPSDRTGVWVRRPNAITQKTEEVYVPAVELTVKTKSKYRGRDIFAKVHVYNKDGKYLLTLDKPTLAFRAQKRNSYVIPQYYEANKNDTLYFTLPSQFLNYEVKLVAVFGDQKGATMATFPTSSSIFGMDYPEKKLVENPAMPGERKATIDPVLEYTVQTNNPKQPVITLLLREPNSVSDPSEIKGVLALCLLAPDVPTMKHRLEVEANGDDRIRDDIQIIVKQLGEKVPAETAFKIRKILEKVEPGEDERVIDQILGPIFKGLTPQEQRQFINTHIRYTDVRNRLMMNTLVKFAEKHKLAILAWGSRRLWDATKLFEDLNRAERREADRDFDQVANAWERGAKQITKELGIEPNQFLLWGHSSAAQYVNRLALRKPEMFLAVHMHIPRSLDEPTPAASNVMWCLTAGESDVGYSNSLLFLSKCQKLNYPIIFKAIPGLGHSSHPDTTALGIAFFEYALSKKELKNPAQTRSNIGLGNNGGNSPHPWLADFKTPPFYADVVNQEVVFSGEAEMIPKAFRISLPTSELNGIWSRQSY